MEKLRYPSTSPLEDIAEKKKNFAPLRRCVKKTKLKL
jgi:hypothetical protein